MAMTFEQFLTERYRNLLPGDKEQKQKYKDEVYALLTDSYKAVGGLKGSGFESADAMVESIPFWKIFTRNGKVIACAMYKDKGGRKRVAVGSDGSADAKSVVASIFTHEFSRAYFEISDRSLKFHVRILGYDFLKRYAKTIEEVKKIDRGEITPAPADDPEVKAHPPLAQYFYQRKIGGKPLTKIMFGTTGKTIVRS